MAITMEQALRVQTFHQSGGNGGRPCDSPRGPVRWRRNGKTKTWKTRPNDFQIPVKHGLYEYDYVTDIDGNALSNVHAAEDCPVEAYRGY